MKNFRVHPATWLFLLILILTGFEKIILPYIISISLHELAHAHVAKKLGYSLNKVWILPYGACVSYNDFSFQPKDEIKIAIAGPLANAFLICATVMLWWIIPSFYVVSATFVVSNFSIMLFNLLPAFPLDGGRILSAILKLKLKNKTVFKIIFAINLIFSLFFLILFIISAFYKINFSFGLISIFLFLGILDGKFQGKYCPLFSQIEKRKRKILQVKNVYISSSCPLFKFVCEVSKTKFTVFFVEFASGKVKMLTETQISLLCENNSLETPLEKIVKET